MIFLFLLFLQAQAYVPTIMTGYINNYMTNDQLQEKFSQFMPSASDDHGLFKLYNNRKILKGL